jgi:hypothetical protein
MRNKADGSRPLPDFTTYVLTKKSPRAWIARGEAVGARFDAIQAEALAVLVEVP